MAASPQGSVPTELCLKAAGIFPEQQQVLKGSVPREIVFKPDTMVCSFLLFLEFDQFGIVSEI